MGNTHLTKKTEARTYLKEYWVCNIPWHRHTTETIASNCIKVRPKPFDRKDEKLKELSRILRAGKLLELILAGDTITKASEMLGVKKARGSQILVNIRGKLVHPYNLKMSSVTKEEIALVNEDWYRPLEGKKRFPNMTIHFRKYEKIYRKLLSEKINRTKRESGDMDGDIGGHERAGTVELANRWDIDRGAQDDIECG